MNAYNGIDSADEKHSEPHTRTFWTTAAATGPISTRGDLPHAQPLPSSPFSLSVLSLSSANAISPTLTPRASSSLISSPSLSHVISLHTSMPSSLLRQGRLLDTPHDRALIWPYMDNYTAVQYLSTCQHLRRLYHSFPLAEPVSVAQLGSVRAMRDRDKLSCCPRLFLFLLLPVGLGVYIGLLTSEEFDDDSEWTIAFLFALIVFIFVLVVQACIWSCLLPGRTDCCDDGRMLTRLISKPPMPRIIRLKGTTNPLDVSYLRHVEEADVREILVQRSEDSTEEVTIRKHQLPHSLRVLALTLHAWSSHKQLTVHLLPPRLTVFALTNIGRAVLSPRVLPRLIRTLVLHYHEPQSPDYFVDIQPIAAEVLPSHLQWLYIEWTRSMNDIALPASLIRLDVIGLPNLPIPPGSLPAHLHTLCITTSSSFSPYNLIGAVPSRLQVLRLHCHLNQSPTAELFATMPRLKELDLPTCDLRELRAGVLMSLTRLRILRVGCQDVHSLSCADMPASLQRLIVVCSGAHDRNTARIAAWNEEVVVEFQNTTPALSIDEVFEHSRTGRFANRKGQVQHRSG